MQLELPDHFQSDRLIFQRLKYEDAEEIFYCYASKPEATKYVSWPTHQNIKDSRDFLNYAVGAWEGGIDYSFSIRLKGDNRLVGSIGAVNEQGKIQIGYILSPTFWGQGLATEACMGLVNILRQQKEIFRISSFVDADHQASANVLEKVGFVEEARLEKWFRFVNQGNEPKDCILFRYPLGELSMGEIPG